MCEIELVVVMPGVPLLHGLPEGSGTPWKVLLVCGPYHGVYPMSWGVPVQAVSTKGGPSIAKSKLYRSPLSIPFSHLPFLCGYLLC